jgi:hypothetical protein
VSAEYVSRVLELGIDARQHAPARVDARSLIERLSPRSSMFPFFQMIRTLYIVTFVESVDVTGSKKLDLNSRSTMRDIQF